MTRLEDRQILIRDIAQACMEGARLAPACALAGIDVRTLQRWKVTAQVGRSKQVCGRVCAGKNLLLAANSPVARDAESYLGTPEGYLGSYEFCNIAYGRSDKR